MELTEADCSEWIQTLSRARRESRGASGDGLCRRADGVCGRKAEGRELIGEGLEGLEGLASVGVSFYLCPERTLKRVVFRVPERALPLLYRR